MSWMRKSLVVGRISARAAMPGRLAVKRYLLAVEAFRTSDPALGHSAPGCLALRITGELSHALAIGGMPHEFLGWVQHFVLLLSRQRGPADAASAYTDLCSRYLNDACHRATATAPTAGEADSAGLRWRTPSCTLANTSTLLRAFGSAVRARFGATMSKSLQAMSQNPQVMHE